MKNLYRIVLHCTQDRPDNRTATQLVIDLPLNSETRQWTGPHNAFGYYGDASGPKEDLWPFILVYGRNGNRSIIRYGHSNSNDEYININLRPIEIGAQFTYFMGDEEKEYVVVKTERLLAGS
jgi:hypothetical protein